VFTHVILAACAHQVQANRAVASDYMAEHPSTVEPARILSSFIPDMGFSGVVAPPLQMGHRTVTWHPPCAEAATMCMEYCASHEGSQNLFRHDWETKHHIHMQKDARPITRLPKKLKLCHYAGYCVCKGASKYVVTLRLRLKRAIDKYLKDFESKAMWVRGNVVIKFTPRELEDDGVPIADSQMRCLDEHAPAPAVIWAHSAHLQFVPWRISLLRLEPADHWAPRDHICLQVVNHGTRPACYTTWEFLGLLSLRRSWDISFYLLSSTPFPLPRVKPGLVFWRRKSYTATVRVASLYT
jgi:hypothetical protein